MQNLRKQIAERFTEERERLRFSQSDLANKLGVSREGLRKNEIGATALNADTLAIAVELGFDIQYVLSGIRSKNLEDVEKEVGAHVHIQSGGTGNVVQHAQAGSTINMVSTQKHITRTTVKTDPDGTHISVAQQAKIQRLVDDIVELESRVKKEPKTYRAVWSTLNRRFQVPSYKLIPLEYYDDVEKYLRQWIGRLNNTKMSAITDNDKHRSRRYAFIHTNLPIVTEEWFRSYLHKNFKVSSMKDLNDSDLEKAYQAVSRKKRTMPS